MVGSANEWWAVPMDGGQCQWMVGRANGWWAEPMDGGQCQWMLGRRWSWTSREAEMMKTPFGELAINSRAILAFNPADRGEQRVVLMSVSVLSIPGRRGRFGGT